MKRKWWVIAGAMAVVVVAIVVIRANSRLLWTMSELDLVSPIMFSPEGNLVVCSETGIDEVDAGGRLLRNITENPDVRLFHAAGKEGFYAYFLSAGGPDFGLVEWDGSIRWSLGEDTSPMGPVACAPDGTLYFYEQDWNLLVYRPDGTMAWERIGNAASSGPPAVGLDGSVAVLDPAVVLLEADGSERWRRSLGSRGMTFVFRDEPGNVYVAGPELVCFDPSGNQLWPVNNPSNADMTLPNPSAGSPGLHFTGLRVGPRGWVYAVSIEGVMQVFDERGRHQWSFKKGTLAYGSDWIAFTDSGDALLCASDFKPLNVPGGRLTKLGIGGVETNRRLVCLSPAGQVVWEQSVPVDLDWRLPRSRAELHEYWQRRFGFRDSQHLNGPVIGPDGTIFVLGSTVRSLNKLYAIRGD